MFEDFDAAIEAAWLDVETFAPSLGLDLLAVTELIDGALDDLKHQRLVDTNKVTNWLLDIRNLING